MWGWEVEVMTEISEPKYTNNSYYLSVSHLSHRLCDFTPAAMSDMYVFFPSYAIYCPVSRTKANASVTTKER